MKQIICAYVVIIAITLYALATCVVWVSYAMMFAGARQIPIPKPNLNYPNNNTYFFTHNGSSSTDVLHVYKKTSENVLDKSLLIFYLHGNLGDIESWRIVYEKIQEEAESRLSDTFSITVASFDYRGYGLSSNGPPTPTNSIQDATEILKSLHRHNNYSKTVVYGRSVGCAIAAGVVSNYSKVNHLFLETPFLGSHSIRAKFTRMFPPIFDCTGYINSILKKGIHITTVSAKYDQIVDPRWLMSKYKENNLMHHFIVPSKRHDHNSVFQTSYWNSAFNDMITLLNA